MFYHTVTNYSNKPLFNYKKDNVWNELTGSDIHSIVKKIAFSLRLNDINAQDKVAILSNTSYEWALCDYGIITSGAVTTTIYPTLLPGQIKYILSDSDSKLVFVEDSIQLEKVKSIIDDCALLKKIVVMDNSLENEEKDILNLNSFMILNPDEVEAQELDFEKMISSVKPDDLLTLIYTSGTTGQPKGVMLTHDNLISNVKGVQEISTIEKNDSFLSFLPLSHVLERMAGHFSPFSVGAKIYYAENMESVAKNMSEVSPSIVICVPRVFEKMYNAFVGAIEQSSIIKKKLFYWALQVGKDYTNIVHANYKVPFYLNLKHRVASKLIYKKIHERLGGKIKFFISGGAPLSRNVAEFFAGLDIVILEGYGLTETSPVLTASRPGKIRFGSPGVALSNVEMKIANDGEIIVKGPNIMKGYYKSAEATKEVFDDDGWFHTGDIGEIDQDGFLKITDRKKSLIVTSAGKNIAPAPLESAVCTSDYIDQALVLGDKRNFISALIVPSFDNVKEYLKKKGKEVSSNEAIIEHLDVIELIDNEVNKLMEPFSKTEKVKKCVLLPRPFAIEKGEMTPKMSIVRKVVEKNFEDQINNIYKDANK
tara:strand:- start:2679 stop:4460 length:1782 start_codon:yes stop_codon:yes gene_type:complete